jgi:hypothetical protein
MCCSAKAEGLSPVVGTVAFSARAGFPLSSGMASWVSFDTEWRDARETAPRLASCLA